VLADCICRYHERFQPDAVWLSADTWVTAEAMGAAVAFPAPGQPMAGTGETLVRTASDIDKALKLGLNHPMGPFEMIDLVGLDVRLSVLQRLSQSLGELYRPNNLLLQYVQAGRLGKKVGRGVYAYDDSGKRID